jgi:hypothetical protein
MALTAAASPSSLPRSSTGRFNAEGIVTRTLIAESPLFRYLERFSLRIKEWVVREAINLSLARKRPDLSFGGVTASSVSSSMDGSTRV